MINKTVFFEYVRKLPFGGRLTPDNVEGLEKILDYKTLKYPNMPDVQLAYVLATVFHETAGTMQPIVERGSDKYLRSKKYWPWIGRGLIQITWKANYDKYGITNPEDALTWPVALKVLFDGMVTGKFTGKKLSDYFNDDKTDPVWARSIVNGKRKGETLPDKANLIRDYYNAFKNALEASQTTNKVEQVVEQLKEEKSSPTAVEALPNDTTKLGVNVAAAGTIVSTVIASISNPWALGALVVVAIGLYLVYSGRLVITQKAGV